MQYDAESAVVVNSDIMPSALIAHTPVETLKVLLNKMGIGFVDGLIKDAYVGAFHDAIINDPSLILYFLTEDMIEFLIGVWDCSNLVYLDDRSYYYMDYLKMFGFLGYLKGNSLSGTPNEIHVTGEMKDIFYFYLKSRNSKKIMDRYHEWELVIGGMLYYYGLVELDNFYHRFCGIVGDTGYDEFFKFINLRSSLWAVGSLMNSRTGTSWYGLNDLTNPDLLLLYIRENTEIDYRDISKEDLIYVSEAGGIDNRWDGISELGLLLIDEAGLNYYRATVAVRNFINMIHNGEKMDALYEKMDILIYQGGELLDKANAALEKMYYSIPVFEYKGHNRLTYDEIYREIQLKNRRKNFKIYK